MTGTRMISQSSEQIRVWRSVTIASAVITVAALSIEFRCLRAMSHHGTTVFTWELARTSERARSILQSWGPAGRSAAITASWIDFGFIAGYTGIIVGLSRWLAAASRPTSPAARRGYAAAAWPGIAAGLANVVAKIVQLLVADGHTSPSLLAVGYATAVANYMFVAGALAAVLSTALIAAPTGHGTALMAHSHDRAPACGHVAGWLRRTLRSLPVSKSASPASDIDSAPASSDQWSDSDGGRSYLRTLPVLSGTGMSFEIERALADPVSLFVAWLQQAIAAGVSEPHAMTISTIDEQGMPRARVLILKAVDDAGWHFAVSSVRQKGRDLAAHPVAALTFYWPALVRQVRYRFRRQ